MLEEGRPLIRYDCCPYKDEQRQTQRKNDHEGRGKDWSCAAVREEPSRLPEAARDEERSSSGACEGVWPCQILDFELVAPRIVRK